MSRSMVVLYRKEPILHPGGTRAFCCTAENVEDAAAQLHKIHADAEVLWTTRGTSATAAHAEYMRSLETKAAWDGAWRAGAVPAPQHGGYAASFCRDQYSPGETGYADPRELQWWYVAEFPIARLNDAPDADWFRGEEKTWAEEGQPHRYADMLDRPIDEPIVVYDTPTGAWLWDGNHRVGACQVRGITTIPAYVGMRCRAVPIVAPTTDVAAEVAIADSDSQLRNAKHDREDAKLQVLLMDTLTMLRDLKQDWPWKELANSYEDVLGRAKALGLPVDEIDPL
ncbi:MAG: hypothetical protein EPN36_14405 [Rhodanobacteraceae bacterium]|nr:MAG: hypothetical protein EPN36_14405 [Rhodanobacteraceae bacterium]